ncbi:unnamed protein product [Eruca vesicaria subsp. sativa]|uniref:Uncharacterized protein n=1 Tax=Eruca vesicaria subsp. sativa TaxID=29727 RepID=A0ABC8J3G9_ERUVS|nr:unnamed protein product [Eruca vesicaria subsp. sativa]
MASSSKDDPNIDPEVRFIMEGTARLVAKHGLWLESRFLKYNTDNKLYKFLRSPDHHYHTFYRNKIVEYRNAQRKKVIKPFGPTNNVAQPPTLKIKCPEGMSPKDFGVIKLTAQFVVRYGRYFWSDLLKSVTMNPNPQLSFINASDYRFNVLLDLVDAYGKILTPYWKRPPSKPKQHACKESFLQGFFNILQGKKQDEEEGVEIEIERAVFDLHDLSGCLDYFACSDDGKWKLPGRISAKMLSDGMLDSPPTNDDAQGQPVPLFTDPDPLIPREYPFTYPKGITRRQLGIIKVTAQFYVRYGYAFWMALIRRVAIIENSHLNSLFEFTMSEGRYSFFYRLVAAYSKVLMPSCTCPERAVLKGKIRRVSTPNVESGQVIEITLQSLSKNVASLKEKIARKIQIPANKQKLWGKAGFLKKDNMSLAHYYAEARETLIMSL